MEKPGKEGALALLPEKKHKNAIDKLAAKLDLSPDKLVSMLKATAFSLCKEEAQFVAAVVVANTYGLNPILREMTAFPGKSGGVVPVVMIDGWIKLVNRQETYNGVELIENLAKEGTENKSGTFVESITAKFYLKNRDHPVVVTEYMDECFDPTKEPWKRWPRRMLRHKAYIQGARVAFGFSGIYDEDEKDRIIEAEPMVTEPVTEPVIELKGDKNKKSSEKPVDARPEATDGSAKEPEIVDDPLEYVRVVDLARFGENSTKAKFMSENIAKCGEKLKKEAFMKLLGEQGWTSLQEVLKYEDLVKLTNVFLEEVKKLEQ